MKKLIDLFKYRVFGIVPESRDYEKFLERERKKVQPKFSLLSHTIRLTTGIEINK